MKPLFFILSLSLLNCGQVLAAEVPAMTSADAVKVLQTSNDLQELTAAVKVAAADPATRVAVATFFAMPSRVHEVEIQYDTKHLPFTAEQLHNQEFMDQWNLAHPEEAKKYDDDWRQYGDASNQEVQNFFAQIKDPHFFELYMQFENNSVLKGVWEGWWYFKEALPKDSPMAPLFLDYVDKASQSSEVEGPLMLIRIATNKNYAKLVEIDADTAYARLDQNLAAGKYSPQVIREFMSMSDLDDRRLDPRIFPFYMAIFGQLSDDAKFRLIKVLFDTRFEIDGPPPPVISFDTVDPATYQELAKFFYDAGKLKMPDDIAKILADYKTHLLALYAKHGMTPPTDAELAAMPTIVIPATPAASAPAKASASARPTAPTVEASPLPLYVIGGTIVVLAAAFIFFRRR